MHSTVEINKIIINRKGTVLSLQLCLQSYWGRVVNVDDGRIKLPRVVVEQEQEEEEEKGCELPNQMTGE